MNEQTNVLPPPPARAFTSCVFVVTGFSPEFSQRLQDYLRLHRGMVYHAVAPSTDYVILGPSLEFTSELKLRVARQHNVPIVPFSTFSRGVDAWFSGPRTRAGITTPSVAEIFKNVQQTPHVQEEQLWTERYRPLTRDQLLTDRVLFQRLLNGITQWYMPGAVRRPVLLQGPAGSGKTSAMRVLAHETHHKIYEFNASLYKSAEQFARDAEVWIIENHDAHTKKKGNKRVGKCADDTSTNSRPSVHRQLSFASKPVEHTIVVLEEVDGLASTCSATLRRLITCCPAPTFLTANQIPLHLLWLRDVCDVVNWPRLPASIVMPHLQKVLAEEKLPAQSFECAHWKEQLDKGDIRQVITHMQWLKSTAAARAAIQRARVNFGGSGRDVGRPVDRRVKSIVTVTVPTSTLGAPAIPITSPIAISPAARTTRITPSMIAAAAAQADKPHNLPSLFGKLSEFDRLAASQVDPTDASSEDAKDSGGARDMRDVAQTLFLTQRTPLSERIQLAEQCHNSLLASFVAGSYVPPDTRETVNLSSALQASPSLLSLAPLPGRTCASLTCGWRYCSNARCLQPSSLFRWKRGTRHRVLDTTQTSLAPLAICADALSEADAAFGVSMETQGVNENEPHAAFLRCTLPAYAFCLYETPRPYVESTHAARHKQEEEKGLLERRAWRLEQYKRFSGKLLKRRQAREPWSECEDGRLSSAMAWTMGMGRMEQLDRWECFRVLERQEHGDVAAQREKPAAGEGKRPRGRKAKTSREEEAGDTKEKKRKGKGAAKRKGKCDAEEGIVNLEALEETTSAAAAVSSRGSTSRKRKDLTAVSVVKKKPTRGKSRTEKKAK